jgi:hypothetical protein
MDGSMNKRWKRERELSQVAAQRQKRKCNRKTEIAANDTYLNKVKKTLHLHQQRSCSVPMCYRLALVILLVCGPALSEAVTLRVLLYPNIPDTASDGFASLVASMTKAFKVAAPDVDLQLALDPSQDVYDPLVLKKLFTTPGAGGYDVVEIDTVMLDAVATLASPWELDGATVATFSPVGLAAATLPGGTDLLAFPHLACSNFLASKVGHGGGATLGSLAAVKAAFTTVVPPPSDVLVAAKLGGSWDLPTVYIRCVARRWQCQCGTGSASESVTLRVGSHVADHGPDRASRQGEPHTHFFFFLPCSCTNLPHVHTHRQHAVRHEALRTG